MKKLSYLFFKFWRPAVVIIAIALVAYVLFFHNLAHLLPGYSNREASNYAAGHTLRPIIQSPLNAPYKLFVYAGEKLAPHSHLVVRAVSASFAVVASLLFFMVARSWYGYRTAFLTTIMFATSAGFLHVARLGSPLILQMSILLVIWLGMWWREHKQSSFTGFLLVAVLAGLWYVPGMVLFEAFGIILVQKKLRLDIASAAIVKRILAAVLFLVITGPLLISFVRHPLTLLAFAGLPSHLAGTSATVSNIGNSLLSVAIHSSGSAELWLGHVPLLNAIELVLLLLGIYVYIQRKIPVRSLFLLGAVILSLLLIGLGGPVATSSLLPLLYLVIGAGLYELLKQWLRVFPRNPFARFTGVFLLCSLVAFSVAYQYRAYFVAWPNTAATKQVFNL